MAYPYLAVTRQRRHKAASQLSTHVPIADTSGYVETAYDAQQNGVGTRFK